MNKLVTGQFYRVKKNFHLKSFAKKGERLWFQGKPSDYYAHLYGKNPHRLVLMTKKEAFEFLEELPKTETPRFS